MTSPESPVDSSDRRGQGVGLVMVPLIGLLFYLTFYLSVPWWMMFLVAVPVYCGLNMIAGTKIIRW
jgi:hypothetical protein